MMFISDLIRCALQLVTVSFVRRLARLGRITCAAAAPQNSVFRLGAENENLTVAQLSLTALAIAVLFAALPGTIESLSEQAIPIYYPSNSLRIYWPVFQGLAVCRFIFQPSVAIFIGLRDGIKDSRVGCPPFLLALVYHPRRTHLLRSALASVRDLVAVAIILDVISQLIIFKNVHGGAALLLGRTLIALPYSIARALGNRIAQDPSRQ